ncbi:toll/interleukin-1 receptor-like protein [Bidens hawaiensis]|uniref:toll/interleukin-1 receptor-like protein n=1 Tax=Bidens hawaiensis TaxID=980011 RepID=UPI00404ABA5D
MNPSSPSCSKRKRNPSFFDHEPITCKKPKYDVFVNYSFKDVGNSFVRHLQGALHRNSFTVSDHTLLPVGQDVCLELLKAIQESKIFVVVFSTNYASSLRCLDELVDIMDCFHKFDGKRKVFPVFFKVEPSHVRSQHGVHGSFPSSRDERRSVKVQKWKQALKEAGQLSGLTFQNGDDEAEFVLKIVEDLEKMQNPQELHVTDHPVGVGSRAEELISKLRLDCKDHVLVVAVFGISGIGSKLED